MKVQNVLNMIKGNLKNIYEPSLVHRHCDSFQTGIMHEKQIMLFVLEASSPQWNSCHDVAQQITGTIRTIGTIGAIHHHWISMRPLADGSMLFISRRMRNAMPLKVSMGGSPRLLEKTFIAWKISWRSPGSSLPSSLAFRKICRTDVCSALLLLGVICHMPP